MFALLVVALLVPVQYVKAEQYDEISQEVNYAAISGADEVQNNLDDGSRTNLDTWDPVPSGVWFGGWAIESRLRLSEVPDDDFQIALATVCYFGADLIMSGAARTLVRLPVHTSDDPWTSARLNIYEIDETTNWTFSKIDDADAPGTSLNDMKVNFTSGSHELIFWSPALSPTDVSPTDGNDHFTRSNRTYAFVDAPIKPDTYYLFITYVWYASDKYVEVYIEPDSLDSSFSWNRSTIAVYNEQAPDTYTLDVDNFNISCGYSFDFRNGFGNSAYGLNVYWVQGDEIEIYTYVDPDKIVSTDYFTFMLPYRSTVANLSWDISVRIYNWDTGGLQEIMAFQNYICNDFILASMEQDWGTNMTAMGTTFDGWLKISCEVQNETRIWFPLWDIPPADNASRINSSWVGTPVHPIWDSGDPLNYNLEQFVQVQYEAGTYYNYHWRVQHSIQWNDYYWQRTAPKTSGSEEDDITENMSLTSKVIYGFGGFLITVGDWVAPVFPLAGTTLRAAGTGAQLLAIADVVPDFLGGARDFIYRIADFFKGIGTWIWRAAQEVIGFIRWFVETITYFASVILAILVFAIALVLLLLPMWFAAKLGMVIVNAARGKREAAIKEMQAMASFTLAATGRGS
jgi:hypothetical protein